MAGTQMFSRIATPFDANGEVDEVAMRAYLQQFIDNGIGVYLTSGGAGEGHSLTWEECRRVYEIGLSECKGKIPVYANPPEKYTVRDTIAYTRLAIDCGMELVSIYPVPSRHGMKPTNAEIVAYFDDVLADIDHPIIVGVNANLGYQPSAAAIAEACNRHSQIVAINLSAQTDKYMLELMERSKRDISYHVRPDGSLNKLTLGANGVFSTEANLIPKTFRRYIELYDAGNLAEIGAPYRDLLTLSKHCDRWMPSIPRWLKMGMRCLKMPGGEGGLREPYRMPPEEEYRQFCDGLLSLGIAEIEERAHAAGLELPNRASAAR